MRPVEKVLDRLSGVIESNGSWKALCPAHDDREPTLSVTEGDDGRNDVSIRKRKEVSDVEQRPDRSSEIT